MPDKQWDFTGLKAIFFNGTLTKSPAPSHTGRLIENSKKIMESHGVEVEVIRTIDHPDIATGIYPDMREHGWDKDEWPEIYERVKKADILVIAGPIWLGDNSSMTKKIIEKLYACSGLRNKQDQYDFYGKVGGALITGNEDGVKHCAMNILYSLQHVGCVIPPQADAGWIGEIGPGPSYGDDTKDSGKVGFDSEFTNRNTTFMTWNLMHLAKMLKNAGGIPMKGNQAKSWNDGTSADYANPEYR